MKTKYRLTVDGHRTCHRCDRSLPATPDNFLRDKSRSLGLAYECRDCHRQRKLGRDNRTDQWAKMTRAQRAKVRARQFRYYHTGGRAIFQVSSYRKHDKKHGFTSDIDAAWMRDNIYPKACVYCGATDEPLGCDRVDNSRGHTKDNVVPACTTCNRIRGNYLTHEEMKMLGPAMTEIKRRRRDARL